MSRTRTTVLTGWLALFLFASLAHGAVVQVGIERASGTGPIEVGNSVTVNVRAHVNQPASSTDGIFTYDSDLIIANLLAGRPSNFQVQSVIRPEVNDALLAGSNGQATAAGLHTVYGGYLDTSIGINSDALLYSVTLLAVTPGTTTLTPGPAVDPYGFDFVLYQSAAPTVLYPAGLSLSVVPSDGGTNTVPLPAGATSGLALGLWIMVRRFVRQRRILAQMSYF